MSTEDEQRRSSDTLGNSEKQGLAAVPTAGASAAGGNIRMGYYNDAADRETALRSVVPGDKATLAIFNEIKPGNRPPFPDGLRVFTSPPPGQGESGGGAAIQAFGGQGTFSPAPRGGIGLRATGSFTGVIGISLNSGPGDESGSGVFGRGDYGVHGESAHAQGAGVYGKGHFGVQGVAAGYNDTGVFGLATSGVKGQGVGVAGSANVGTGVHGYSPGGTGILAEAGPGGATAFEAKGPVKFSSAGIAQILQNTKTVTVTPGIDINENSKVLCTLQSNGGILQNVIKNIAAGTFAINLTADATETVLAAWFVIS